MKRIVLTILMVTGLALSSRATTIQLELYNSYPLLDHDGLTPLAGDSSAGDLVQVILAGVNGSPNAPTAIGGVGGDDTLLFTLHVGEGIPASGTGLLDVFPLDYSSALVDSNYFVRFWNGDARGRWEGDTLVVDITNFRHTREFQGSRENLHLIERFRRVSEDRLEYTVTADDPTTWTRPWTVLLPMRPSEGELIEYACHEGNLSLRNILEVARDAEKAAAKAGDKP